MLAIGTDSRERTDDNVLLGYLLRNEFENRRWFSGRVVEEKTDYMQTVTCEFGESLHGFGVNSGAISSVGGDEADDARWLRSEGFERYYRILPSFSVSLSWNRRVS
jgi:hypothetical protein